MHSIQCKRIYEEKTENDGFRILTDRLWPRGITKERAALDNWAKDMSPSTFLRKTFNHKEENFPLFEKKYWEELEKNPGKEQFIALVREQLRQGNVSLLYATKEERFKQAVVLVAWLKEKLLEEAEEHSA